MAEECSAAHAAKQGQFLTETLILIIRIGVLARSLGPLMTHEQLRHRSKGVRGLSSGLALCQRILRRPKPMALSTPVHRGATLHLPAEQQRRPWDALPRATRHAVLGCPTPAPTHAMHVAVGIEALVLKVVANCAPGHIHLHGNVPPHARSRCRSIRLAAAPRIAGDVGTRRIGQVGCGSLRISAIDALYYCIHIFLKRAQAGIQHVCCS